MRLLLRSISVMLLVTAIAWWWKAGAHPGWTKTTDKVWKYDEITEISYPETVERFTPGVDFLASAAFASAILAGVSFIFGRKAGHPPLGANS